MTTPGFDAASGLYYAPDPDLVLPPIPNRPSAADLCAAVERLDDVIAEFQFVSPADRAHALALALLPAARELIPGSTPLHLIDATAPGTGKTLLAQALLGPTIGPHIAMLGECNDGDEWRKRLTSKLRTGPAVVMFDNIRKRLDSGHLALALTTGLWEDRILGESIVVNLPVRNIWVATGNNLRLSTELMRRAIRVRLDANVERPWLRQGFRHTALLAWVATHRGELLAAVLTLVHAWIIEGRPAYDGRTVGSFDAWARTIGGILKVAGVSGFLANAEQVYDDADDELEAWRRLVAEWWNRLADQPVRCADLLGLVEALCIDGLGLNGVSERGRQTALGRKLREYRDRVIGEYRVTQAGHQHGASLWRLVRLTPPAPA